ILMTEEPPMMALERRIWRCELFSVMGGSRSRNGTGNHCRVPGQRLARVAVPDRWDAECARCQEGYGGSLPGPDATLPRMPSATDCYHHQTFHTGDATSRAKASCRSGLRWRCRACCCAP